MKETHSAASETLRETVLQQILAIRDSGEANMLACRTVHDIALRDGYYELADFISSDSKSYFQFILQGDKNLLPE